MGLTDFSFLVLGSSIYTNIASSFFHFPLILGHVTTIFTEGSTCETLKYRQKWPKIVAKICVQPNSWLLGFQNQKPEIA